MSINAESRPAPLHRFEDAAYQGYGVRRPAGPDVELARIGPGTPAGEYPRRFWHPVALSSELADLPVALRILGEELVVFRDGEGRIGLVHRRCAHRRASLEYGTCRHRGIRCCYHGWHFDIDGTLLDVPGQPPEVQARLKHRVRLGAYPAFEYRGLVFAYLGPPEVIPEFPVYDTFKLPDMEMVPYRAPFRCNWLQVLDAIVDPIHTSFLHSSISREQFSAGFGEIGRIDFFDRGAWLMGTNTRRVSAGGRREMRRASLRPPPSLRRPGFDPGTEPPLSRRNADSRPRVRLPAGHVVDARPLAAHAPREAALGGIAPSRTREPLYGPPA